MPTLLHIDSSPLYGFSVSRELSAAFVAQWKSTHPDGKVIVRDLNATPLHPIDAAWVGAMATPKDARTPEQNEKLALSETLLAELAEADQYVIGAPLYNFNVASTLKLWIDQIVRVGETFTYVDGRPQGLLVGKKAAFLVSSGGNYEPGTPMAALGFVDPYLRGLFGFLGIADITVINAGGMSALRHGADRATLLAPHLAATTTLAETF